MSRFEDYLGRYIVVFFTDRKDFIKNREKKYSLNKFLEERALKNLKQDQLVIIDKNMGVKIATDKIEEILIILHPETVQSDELEKLVEEVKKKDKKILAAIHKDIQESIRNKEKGVADFSGEYIHELGEEYVIWNSFAEMCIAIKENDDSKFKENFIKLVDGIKKSIVKDFSLLKHRIAHCFLSMDIDLQGIREVSGGKAIDYLKETLEDKEKIVDEKKIIDPKANPAYYRRKLADLHYLLLGERIGTSTGNSLSIPCGSGEDFPCDYVGQTQDLKLSKGNKAIYDLIEGELREEQSKEKESEKLVTGRWANLLQLGGLTGSFAPDLNSSIFRFMCFMDCEINKVKSEGKIEPHDVREVLDFPWKNSGICEQVTSFHQWFVELDEAIADLREKIIE